MPTGTGDTGKGGRGKDVCRKNSRAPVQRFLLSCEIKDQAICLERKGQSEREVEGDGQSRLEKYKGHAKKIKGMSSIQMVIPEDGREKKSCWFGWRVGTLRSVGRVMTTYKMVLMRGLLNTYGEFWLFMCMSENQLLVVRKDETQNNKH